MAKIFKRFTIRKIKKYSYQQECHLKDCGYIFAIYDREWKKNIHEAHAWCNDDECGNWKYIDYASKKEVAKHWVDWLNANLTEKFGHKITIPMKVFNEGLKLYHQEESNCQS